MKRLKTTIWSLLILLLLNLPVYAQWIGIGAGMNVSDILLRDHSHDEIYRIIPGAQTGLTFEFRLVKLLSVESGLVFSSNGAVMESLKNADNDSYDITAHIGTQYLGIPVNGRLYIPVHNSLAFFGTGGFYLKRGINGNVRYRENHNGALFEKTEKVMWGTNADMDDFKPNDWGLGFGIGTQVRFVQIGLHYDLGLADISPYETREIKMYNRSFSFTLNYKITRMRKLIRPFFEDRNEIFIYSEK